MSSKHSSTGEKILLGLLPFWTPLIPPMGISCLKSFLREYGYPVKTFDFTVKEAFSETYNRYFNTLKGCIPEPKRGNFYNMGHDVLQSHMMAHLNYKTREEYVSLVKILVDRNYLHKIDDTSVDRLNEIVAEFYDLLKNNLVALLEKENPRVFGLTVYRGTLPASLFALKFAKEINPHIKTVVGGGSFSQELEISSENFKNFLKQTPYIDNVVIGEGEILFLKYLQEEFPRGRRVCSLKDISNRVVDLSSAVLPDFSDFDIERYPNMAVYASRSCPFQCSFCAETTYWGEYRKKSAAQVVTEMYHLYLEYGQRLFLMCDSLLNPVAAGLAKEFLDSGLSLYWDGYLRADKPVCNHENTLLWRRGGFYRARLGLESGSEKILELMGKRITPGQYKEALSSLAEAGIKTTTYWIMGHPGETEEDFRQTLDFIEAFKDDIYEAECNPFRYFESGQVNSGEWTHSGERVPLYPAEMDPLLMNRTWVLKNNPTWEETIERTQRFVRHCRRLGVLNPYTLPAIYEADERWKELHPNAVPSMADLVDENCTFYESRNVNRILELESQLDVEGDFDFE